MTRALAVEAHAAVPLGRRFCLVAVDLLGVTGSAMSLITDGHRHRAICFSDETAAAIEELQFRHGEGPSLQAHESGTPVLVGDLAASDPLPWRRFAESARGAGVGATFAVPLRDRGTPSLGALFLYRTDPGDLAPNQVADAVALARLAVGARLNLQPGTSAMDLDPFLTRVTADDEIGYVAQRIADALGLSEDEALSRLRVYASSAGLLVSELAHDVVKGRLDITDFAED